MMDLDKLEKFCLDFIKRNKNSQTEKIIDTFTNSSTLEGKCNVFDRAVTWRETQEGFFYFYFLQIRYALEMVKFLYKGKNYNSAKNCLGYVSKFFNYCGYYDDGKNGNVFINIRRYIALKMHYERVRNKISDMVLRQHTL